MAIPIRSIPVLEGNIAQKFLREAKANEKKRGTYKFSKESVRAYNKIIANTKKYGFLSVA
ncbi:MAG: hypothetical protein LBG17_09390 [Bacteroidales bacterium]|jgi:hypothetical protein|nr:hypothetical protein [Bacteroidales bacterium]